MSTLVKKEVKLSTREYVGNTHESGYDYIIKLKWESQLDRLEKGEVYFVSLDGAACVKFVRI